MAADALASGRRRPLDLDDPLLRRSGRRLALAPEADCAVLRPPRSGQHAELQFGRDGVLAKIQVSFVPARAWRRMRKWRMQADPIDRAKLKVNTNVPIVLDFCHCESRQQARRLA